MTSPRPVVTEEDVRAAQVTLDLWVLEDEDGWEVQGQGIRLEDMPGPALLVLRGILAAQFSEVRAAGYLAGHTDATDLATSGDGACIGQGGDLDHVPTLAGTCALCGAVVEP